MTFQNKIQNKVNHTNDHHTNDLMIKMKPAIDKQKMKFFFTLLFSVLIALLSVGLADAAPACSLLTGPNDANMDEDFLLNFQNTYLPPTTVDVTLDLGAQGLTTADPLTVNGVAFLGALSWNVTSTTAGDKTVTAALSTGGVPLCTVEKNFTVYPEYADPSLTISIQTLDDLTLGQNYDVDVDLTNVGPGSAHNISGIVSLIGATSTPSAFIVDTIAVAGVNTTTYVLTPNTCGNANNFVFNVQNYADQGGELMLPVSASEDFNVIGSDLDILSFTTGSAAIPEEGSTTFNIGVQNLGAVTATNAGFRLQRDGNGFDTPFLASLASGATTTMQYGFSAAGIAAGTYNISATVSYSGDCDSLNTKTASFNLTINAATCSDTVLNQGEEQVDCGGPNCAACPTTPTTSGGGSSYDNIIDLDLNEQTPSAIVFVDRGEQVKLRYDGRVYYFRFPRILADYARVEVNTQSANLKNDFKLGDVHVYDLNNDGEGDIQLEILDLKNRQAKVKFKLLGFEEPSNYANYRDYLQNLDHSDVEVQQQPAETEVEEESFVSGIISFVEEFSLRRAATPLIGGGITLLVIVVGLGIYFSWPRKEE